MLYLFLDTNIFLHFLDFEQIDWNKVIDSKGDITIAMPPIVLAELDKQKYNPNQKISKRAKKALQKIHAFIENTETANYPIKYISNRPIDETFTQNSLERREQDDNLLASIIEFNKILNEPDKAFLVTNDIGIKLKAGTLNIKSIKISDEFLLPHEPDELEKKNRTLEKELLELKNKVPVVSLSFIDNSDLVIKAKRQKIISKDIFIQEKLRKIKLDHPYLRFEGDPLANPLLLMSMRSMQKPTHQQVLNYNRELDEFFIKYTAFLESSYVNLYVKAHSIAFQILINNTGTTPAIDIDVEITFPKDIIPYLKEEIPILTEPQLPIQPQTRFDHRNSTVTDLKAQMRSIISPEIKKPIEKAVVFRGKISSVRINVKELKHNKHFLIEPIYTKLPDHEDINGFMIEYKLKISNVPKVVDGKLHVQLKELPPQ